MDDRRFDQLVKAVASGASRRSVLKGMLGLGGAALVGSAALDADVDAARRPTPTPKPVKCPGRQVPTGGVCTCPGDAPNKCGPDCCTGKPGDPPSATHSECCDNACCFGTCYGEELCCPTNPSGSEGQQTPLAELCLATNECCLAPDFCCNIDGCCSTVCWGGNSDDDFCCPADDLCPGGGTSTDRCCTGDTICCGAGTDANTCIDLSIDDACCTASDCGPPAEGTCGWDCSANRCVSFVCLEGSICCEGACVNSSEYVACPTDPNQCCDLETDVCCGEACCARNRCNAGQQCCGSSQFVCGLSCCENVPGALCCGGNTCCMDGKCAGGLTCCTGSDVACGDVCCSEDRCLEGVGCCPENTVPCGFACCDNSTQTCNVASNACECAGGAILCDDVCTLNECCAGEFPAANCQLNYGYDLQCVSCPSGSCDTSSFNGLLCDTDDTDALGKCEDGYCIPCGGGANTPCEINEDCCSGTCQDNGQCTDP